MSFTIYSTRTLVRVVAAGTLTTILLAGCGSAAKPTAIADPNVKPEEPPKPPPLPTK